MTGPLASSLVGRSFDPAALAARYSAVLILLLIVAGFAIAEPAFLSADTMGNTVKQASFIGIAAVGMVFVLLTAGIDLSVGSIMYLGPLLAGIAMRDMEVGVTGALLISVLAGAVMGGINAFFVVVLRIIPFITTLATLFLFRGFGSYLTSSRQLDFPDEVRGFGLATVFGLPMPVIVFAIIVAAAYVILVHTPLGRQIYAFGNDAEGARKAGLPTARLQGFVYIASGMCASLAGFVLISQIGRLDTGFGEGREFSVIAAAVLGGASLFGGVGGAFSAVIGALTIQTVQAGLVYTGINLYLQPLLLGLVIFIAVLLDGLRQARLDDTRRRIIRPFVSAPASISSPATKSTKEPLP
ncbi:MAG: ABC transporter permease [Pseudomonadota bacterium]